MGIYATGGCGGQPNFPGDEQTNSAQDGGNNQGTALDKVRCGLSELEKLVRELSLLEKLLEEGGSAAGRGGGGGGCGSGAGKGAGSGAAGNAGKGSGTGQSGVNGGGDARNDPEVKGILAAIKDEPELKWLSDALGKSSISFGPMEAGVLGTTVTGGGSNPVIELGEDLKNDPALLAEVLVHEGVHAAGGGEDEAYAKDNIIATQIGYGQ